jgi:hypothetical protein
MRHMIALALLVACAQPSPTTSDVVGPPVVAYSEIRGFCFDRTDYATGMVVMLDPEVAFLADFEGHPRQAWGRRVEEACPLHPPVAMTPAALARIQAQGVPLLPVDLICPEDGAHDTGH